MTKTQFEIKEQVQEKYPELVKLIISTESMDDNEKQYWFDTLLSMKSELVDRLFNILETERVQLEDLERKYQEEIKNINEDFYQKFKNHKKICYLHNPKYGISDMLSCWKEAVLGLVAAIIVCGIAGYFLWQYVQAALF